ncbi:hypothetical protein Pelo_12401 [Pelomyxa schiedti]|nr:hypothetical protein Pelo_12401 [Pelomyxa schiedti]
MSGSTVSPSDPDCSLRFPCYGDCGAALKERLLALVSHDIVGQHVQETVKASIEKDTISRALGDSEACGFVTMPSLCSFAGPQVRAISTPVTRQHDEVYWRNLAFTELKQVVGECVVEAVVESKRAYGLLVRLRHAVVSISAELRVSARALPLLCDLGVKGMCHILDDSPDDRKSKLESTPISIDDFREGDSILAAVVSVDVESERVNLSLRNSNVFSVQSMWAKASSATFCDLLNSNQLFHNPHALELLTEAYALDEAGSMLPKVPVPKKYMYTLIRDQQNNQWAKETHVPAFFSLSFQTHAYIYIFSLFHIFPAPSPVNFLRAFIDYCCYLTNCI